MARILMHLIINGNLNIHETLEDMTPNCGIISQLLGLTLNPSGNLHQEISSNHNNGKDNNGLTIQLVTSNSTNLPTNQPLCHLHPQMNLHQDLLNCLLNVLLIPTINHNRNNNNQFILPFFINNLHM